MSSEQTDPPRKRRPRYTGSYPAHFHEKYKELNPEQYPEAIQKVVSKGNTPAGMHLSICVSEILEILNPQPGELGLDATLGFGGHTQALLPRVRPGGRMLGIDVDPIELARTTQRLRALGFSETEWQSHQLNFAGIPKLLQTLDSGFDFILADFGISSMQLDNPERGFTFKRHGPLDLRLNPHQGQSAAELLKTIRPDTLEQILRDYADEPHARLLAEAICQSKTPIQTTSDLTRVIKAALKHTQTDVNRTIRRSFQALRIAVNDELSVLEQFLRNLPFCLNPNGRVALLSFHSGEDKRVKQALEAGLAAGLYREISPEAIRPSHQERYDNPRSKSALLRWAIR
ncbi:MAG: 16S rRNA (cytosine(1402)-N(4))-methyltransferase RsmH [Candidatus Sericytochromatia bacterium]